MDRSGHFFDFCQSHSLLEALRQGDWHQFAKVYNGPGQADIYAERINAAYQASSALLKGLPEPIEIFDFEAFANFFQTLGVKNFKAHEFLFKGSLHSTMAHNAYGLNAMPPQELWQNIAALARVLDRVRDSVGAPIMLTSIYRNAEYNEAIGGSSGSRHMQFSAVDFKIKNGLTPQQWCGELRDMRLVVGRKQFQVVRVEDILIRPDRDNPPTKDRLQRLPLPRRQQLVDTHHPISNQM